MQKLLSYCRRAVDEYDMIKNGERVAALVSGGKDSLTVLTALANLSRFHPSKFELVALTLDLGFPNADFSGIAEYCSRLGVAYYVKKSEIAQILFEHRMEKNPCSLCAKMRRGALNDLAKEYNCSKVALGHHYDDAVETFLMSLLFEGRLHCFSPVTYLSRADVTQIRPLVYMSESEISTFARDNALPVVHNPCPANGHTKREEVKQLIRKLRYDYPDLKSKVLGAMKRAHLNGW